MKIEHTALVEYDEVDANLKMKLPVLFQRFQRAAILHSEQVGVGPASMAAAGGAWIMNRIRAEIHRLPQYGETLTVRTWHRGAVGFRAGRDFLGISNNDIVVAATSQWVYLDLKRKRIAKIPTSVSAPYTEENERVLEPGAIGFEVDKSFLPDDVFTITTRAADYDANGHVNNTVYLDYLETLANRAGVGGGGIRRVGIQYMQEIGRAVFNVQAGFALSQNSVKFRLFDTSAVYAAGFYEALRASHPCG